MGRTRPTRGVRTALVGLALVLLCTGCVPGLLYTNVTTPIDLDLTDTPDQDDVGRSDWKTVSFYVQFDWDSAAIADAARAEGLTRLYYADMHLTYVFFGVWQKRKIKVYGE